MPTQSRSPRRKIHVDLPAELHQKLRIKAAMDEVSMQALVTRLIAAEVKGIVVPRTLTNSRKTTSHARRP